MVVSPFNSSVWHLKNFLAANPNVEFVRFQMVDYYGVLRALMTTVSEAQRLAAQNDGLHMCTQTLSRVCSDGSIIDDGFRPGKDVWRPDWDSLKVCHYAPGNASVMCCVDEAGRGTTCCPRTLLKNIEHSAASKGYNFLVGFEIEFFLVASPSATGAVDVIQNVYSTAGTRNQYFRVVEDCVRAIEKAGVPVWRFHTEWEPGSYEIATSPLTPLLAVDALMYAQEAIKSVAEAAGLHATMYPRPFEQYIGLGLHCNVSISGTETPDCFLAGLLDSSPGLSGILMPSYDSYGRSDFVGGEWLSWGIHNKVCAIKQQGANRWELRGVDATANLYLGLGAVLGAGLVGLEKKEAPKIKAKVSPVLDLSADERLELGMTVRMPDTLEAALLALDEDAVLRHVLGAEFCELYVKSKRKELEILSRMDRKERVRMMMGLF